MTPKSLLLTCSVLSLVAAGGYLAVKSDMKANRQELVDRWDYTLSQALDMGVEWGSQYAQGEERKLGMLDVRNINTYMKSISQGVYGYGFLIKNKNLNSAGEVDEWLVMSADAKSPFRPHIVYADTPEKRTAAAEAIATSIKRREADRAEKKAAIEKANAEFEAQMEKLLACGSTAKPAGDPCSFRITAERGNIGGGKIVLVNDADPFIPVRVEIDAASLKAANPALYDFAVKHCAKK